MRGFRRPSFSSGIALVLALSAAMVVPQGAAEAAIATDHVANCAVRLRATPSTTATIITTLATGDGVTTTGTVTGGAWSATCVTSVAGSSWYKVSAVNGQSVSTLYGVAVVYAATGMFRSAPAYLEGIDTSTWQGAVDYTQVKAAGKSFVIAKATEGIGYLDPRYATTRAPVRNAGLALGAYHYARPDLNPTNPTGEADWFLNNVGLTAGMLVPALDIEVAGTLGATDLQNWVGTWLARVYARTGVRAMIYTSPAFWKNKLADTTLFAGLGYTVLWVAHWFVSAPTVPAANWGGRGWTFWQYDDCGAVPGIGGCVDLDRYNGTDLTRVTYGATFALTSTPASVSVKQGATATFTIGIARTYFTLPVGLSFSGLPAGASATLGPTPTGGGSATLTVATSKSGTITPVGSYPITVTGTSNGLTRSVTATLVVTDGIAPTIRTPVSRLYGGATLGTNSSPVRTFWSASDPSGIAAYLLERQLNGGSWAIVGLPSATSTSVVQWLPFGTTYRYTVKATDKANNSTWGPGFSFQPLIAQETSGSITWGGTWTTTSATYYSGGALKYATANGAWASFAFNGSSVSWVAYRGPNRGSAKVYLDGAYAGTVNLYSSSYAARPVVFAASWGSNGNHTIKVVGLGTVGHPRVDVDGFVTLHFV